ncbi:hypothetical protein [Okeania sp. KiyG1]|uniref:hypothetical protein n=1 Tax=Okeania sp. KiyG1 TaxID=2720165 RepID=UPI001F397422|nr:hypothetical protein [Okeania sp. KiyG1]
MKKTQNLVVNLGITIGTFIFALIVGEIGLRILGLNIPHHQEQIKNQKVNLYILAKILIEVGQEILTPQHFGQEKVYLQN